MFLQARRDVRKTCQLGARLWSKSKQCILNEEELLVRYKMISGSPYPLENQEPIIDNGNSQLAAECFNYENMNSNNLYPKCHTF